MAADNVTSPEFLEEVKEGFTDLPVETTEGEKMSDQTEVELSASPAEEKTDDEACSNQVVEKEAEQNGDKVTYFGTIQHYSI